MSWAPIANSNIRRTPPLPPPRIIVQYKPAMCSFEHTKDYILSLELKLKTKNKLQLVIFLFHEQQFT